MLWDTRERSEPLKAAKMSSAILMRHPAKSSHLRVGQGRSAQAAAAESGLESPVESGADSGAGSGLDAFDEWPSPSFELEP